MIKLDNISKTFKIDFWKKGIHALEDVSFEIKKGEITGFLGANGAGKTTIIKIIMGFINSDQGKIIFDPDLGPDRRSILSNIGFIPEKIVLYPHLTGQNLLNYLGSINNLPKKKLKENIDYWAKRFEVHDALGRKINGYSKGMVQRLGLVSCLIHDPKILILDEPLSGMDPRGRRKIKKIFKELNDSGKTIFFSSHITNDIEAICSELVVIDSGQVIKQGGLDKILGEDISTTYFMKVVGKVDLSLEKIISKKEAGVLTVIELPEENINWALDEITRKNVKLISLKKKRANLEDIIFESNK
ncbi:MAG: ABC transporter ATP-binding protein [Epsilonproteobacteria bacterium]|nr:MAG: ABC transporter ATP-binding protein [Campylobacterota bacterium]RLA65212.1 MAG: ABC transporter ATP-binding protein [Campylobacterota bacterium]